MVNNFLQTNGNVDPTTGQQASWNFSDPDKITNYASLVTDLDAASQKTWAETGGTGDRNEIMTSLMPRMMARISRDSGKAPTSTNKFNVFSSNPVYYGTKEQVRNAYANGDISEQEALRILREGFGGQ